MLRGYAFIVIFSLPLTNFHYFIIIFIFLENVRGTTRPSAATFIWGGGGGGIFDPNFTKFNGL